MASRQLALDSDTRTTSLHIKICTALTDAHRRLPACRGWSCSDPPLKTAQGYTPITDNNTLAMQSPNLLIAGSSRSKADTSGMVYDPVPGQSSTGRQLPQLPPHPACSIAQPGQARQLPVGYDPPGRNLRQLAVQQL